MLIKDDKIYRNLQEQVLENQVDINILKSQKGISDLGIHIVDAIPVTSPTDLPFDYDGEYGDAFLVGTDAPYSLYIWTRSNQSGQTGFWFDWGPLNAPSTVPGPIGPQGLQGPQGVRGSLWYSQSGAPTNTTNVNTYDQAIDGSNGDIYQFNGDIWQLTGNIRGPQGIQGIQGIPGGIGPQGPVGPQGPQGPQGQFIEVIGTLTNINQLPDPTTVPRYSAYLIPNQAGVEHVYLIIGTDELTWHDAGAFGGGTAVTIDGVNQSQYEAGYIPKISINYQIGDDTTVSSNGSEITVSNLQTTGYNAANEQIEGMGTIELPIASSDEISIGTNNNTIQASLTDAVWDKVEEMVGDAKPEEIQLNVPSTSTNGQLTTAQLAALQNNKGAYLMFNNEIYRLEDTQHESGYLVYTHVGYNNTTAQYMVKCITITISTAGWVLTTKEIKTPPNAIYKDTIKNVVWSEFTPSMFSDIFGATWLNTVGTYWCRGQTSADTSGLATKLGFQGTYSIRFDVWLSGYVVITLQDADSNAVPAICMRNGSSGASMTMTGTYDLTSTTFRTLQANADFQAKTPYFYPNNNTSAGTDRGQRGGIQLVRYIDRAEIGMTSTNTIDEFLQAYIKKVAQLYPTYSDENNRNHVLFIGETNPSNQCWIMMSAYSMAEVNADGFPRYLYGQMMRQGHGWLHPYYFSIDNYTWKSGISSFSVNNYTSGNTYIEVSRPDANHAVQLAVGAGGTNRGLFDMSSDNANWLVCAESTNLVLYPPNRSSGKVYVQSKPVSTAQFSLSGTTLTITN